ncbi:MAG: hypothetical protein QM765_07255 [Myxococcales bacterium]
MTEVPESGRFLTALVRNGTDSIELVTIPGCPWGDDPWKYLFKGADTAMLLLDVQKDFEELNLGALSKFGSLTSISRGCVVLTKLDRASAKEDLERTRRLLSESSLSAARDWVIFETRLEDPASLVLPFEWLLKTR